MKVLVTGAAGFIGMHVAKRLLDRGAEVVGIDNLNSYYSVELKQARLAQLSDYRGFRFVKLDLADRAGMEELFAAEQFQRVINFAAQPGARYSLNNPHAYIESNVMGFLNVLEACRHHRVEHLSYASSSSVYGANTKIPFAVTDAVDHPVSLYAATKKSNELMAHTYSHLYGLPTTGIRFFTVYGPWGRPDMAPSLFTSAILEGRPIDLFNDGKMRRDFTYIDDAVEAAIRLFDKVPVANPQFDHATPHPGRSHAPYRLYNVGNHNPVELTHFIATIEHAVGKKAQRNSLPMQPGDVHATYADVEELEGEVGCLPATPLQQGIERFVAWYREYHAL